MVNTENQAGEKDGARMSNSANSHHTGTILNATVDIRVCPGPVLPTGWVIGAYTLLASPVSDSPLRKNIV